ncbi:hypothetical protein EJ07DRAFT_151640 [Lizonia empirigonia]|nr:hypothetical protein EJ07DRAFT_151640 [Lizonia empirigonia]
MASRQKKHLHQQAIKADAVRKAHREEAEKKTRMRAAQGPAVSSSSDLDSTSSFSATMHKSPPPPKAAIIEDPLKDINPTIRKLSGAKSNNGVITEGRNVKKALARRKKAHHVPLLVNSTKIDMQRAIVDIVTACTTPFVPLPDGTGDWPSSTTYHMVNEFPTEFLELPEIILPSQRMNISLTSLKGFNGGFAFDSPAPSLKPGLDARPPRLFKIAPDISSLPLSKSLLSSIEGSQSKFSFAAAPDHVTKVSAPETTAIYGSQPGLKLVYCRPTAVTEEGTFLAMSHPAIHTAALGRAIDLVTAKLVAWARALAFAAYKEEVNHQYATAVIISEGPNLSPEDFREDLSTHEQVLGQQTVADSNDAKMSPQTRDYPPNTSISDLSDYSPAGSVYGDVYRWNKPSKHRIFITARDGHCHVVSAMDSLYDVKVVDEQDSDCESVASPYSVLHFQEDGCEESVPFLSEDCSGDAEGSSSEYAESATYTPSELPGNHRVVSPSKNSSVACDGEDQTASSLELGDDHKWLILTSPATTKLPVVSKKPTETADSSWLALTPSFPALRSEITNSTSNDGQSPSLGREPAPPKYQTPSSPPSISSKHFRITGPPPTRPSPATSPAVPHSSPDWTADLVRTTLGTESLFTFLSILDVSEKSSTTQSSLTTAFLALVASEREKLSLPDLPRTYNTPAVLGSKILPHTIMLGTTSLATFLSRIGAGPEGAVALEEVYRVFKELGAEETRKDRLASTGVMGALGRRIGRHCAGC